MTETQNNYPCLNRKEWQTMTPCSGATAAGMFVVNDNANQRRYALQIISASGHALYDHNNDDWIPITSGVFGTTVAAGACGCYSDWSTTYTATGGSTSTVTVNSAVSNITGIVVGKTIEFLSGTAANIGMRRTITNILTLGGAGTITITLDSAVGGSVANTDTFRISSGTFFVLMTGTLGATSFRKYDMATNLWTSCTNTGLPATWGTDGRLVHTGMLGISYDIGTAAVTSSTTQLDCTGKTWTNDQWINYQVRITGGTGIGQIRVITDNDADSLMFAAGTDLDDTSTFVIEGDENTIYAFGNNSTTQYKYSISANTWITHTPATPRGGAPVAGMSADFVGQTGDAVWADVSNIQDGRYIYSFRGATGVLDRFNIPAGANGSGVWENVLYSPSGITFAAGASSDWNKEFIYLAKEGTAAIPQRFYRYNVVDNRMEPFASDWYLAGAATIGNKMWVKSLTSGNVIQWIYNLQSTSTNLRRMMII